MLNGVEHGNINIHSIVIEHNGRLVTELYRTGKDRSTCSFNYNEGGTAVLGTQRVESDPERTVEGVFAM